jgi:putative tryptophan/tyrosine transport system substrate-binding protein
MQKEARHSAVTGVKFELAINLENWCGQLASRCRRGFLLRADEVIEMSSRREFIMLLGGAAAAWPLAARAQPPARVYRLGLLSPASGPTPNHKTLDDALTALGYREGQNLIVERRYSAGNDSLPILAADLVHANVDVIITETTAAAVAAKKLTATIPIVMATAGDPVQTGLVASLAHPGGDVTGNSIITTDLASKKVGLLHELKPSARRLGHLGDKQIAPDQLAFRETRSQGNYRARSPASVACGLWSP